MNLEERFWSYVDRKSRKECWNWLGGRSHGYGVFTLHTNEFIGAHRFSYELKYGKIYPPELFVLHKCDNPPCVNPYHLFLGTHADNMKDMFRKGRGYNFNHLSAEDNYCAKLSNDDVLNILSLRRDEHLSYNKIAKIYSVSVPTIQYIFKGKTWSSITGIQNDN